MGNWVIHIEGTGAHHNGNSSVDADFVARRAVEHLRLQGQTIEVATFTAGSRDDILPEPQVHVGAQSYTVTKDE
jgi:hypothetical protein